MTPQHAELVEHIRKALEYKQTKEQIYKELLQHGWNLEAIQEGFNAIDQPSNQEKKTDNSTRTIHLILTIGAILIGAGIFSFVAANWTSMSPASKISIILAAMLAAYAGGWYCKETKQLHKTGDALILLGAIIYGAGIFLIAQMFHVRANWPDGFILWMIGILVMAVALESNSLFKLAIPLGMIAFIGHPVGMFTNLYYNPFLLTSSLLLLVSTVITFGAGWIVRRRLPNTSDLY